jgi:hypothetical protein
MRSRCAVYISSSRDFSQEDNRNAVAHDMSACVEGHAKSTKFAPAVFRVITFVYFLAGVSPLAGIVIEPKIWTN